MLTGALVLSGIVEPVLWAPQRQRAHVDPRSGAITRRVVAPNMSEDLATVNRKLSALIP